MKEAVKEFIEHAKGHSKDEVILEIKDLKKNFVNGDIVVEVLRDIDLIIKKGEFISLMGESGSGKSTLLYQIGCLDDPTSGSVLINGVDIHKMKDDDKSKMRRETMGFVFQFYNLIPNLSVEENILLPVVMDGKNPKDYEAKLVEILEIVGLSDKRKALPRQLSGGQQQRVSIARAVIMSPSLLLADEPTGNLDSASTKEVMELFTRLNKEKGITIIQVTHSHETAKYGNRIVKLKDGIVSN